MVKEIIWEPTLSNAIQYGTMIGSQFPDTRFTFRNFALLQPIMTIMKSNSKSLRTRENISSFSKSPSRFLTISWSDALVSAIEDCNETELTTH